jgi:hypothetical protein
MLTIIGFGLFFIIGYAAGMMVENEHNKQKQIKRAKFRHPVNVGKTIEEQMARDGWKI